MVISHNLRLKNLQIHQIALKLFHYALQSESEFA